MDLLQVSGISKHQQAAYVLRDITFTQQQFQKIAIAGETGSGKSTLLKIIAGMVQPDAGEVVFENERVEGPAEKLIPGHPGISYLSQHFELLNNYQVEELLEYSNKLSDEDTADLYEICRISHLLKRRTDQLSGGERQRIALAKLLTTSPRLLLLDEPYSNLDMIHKSILKSVIRDISERLQITCMLISHDPVDILSWADEIIVLRDGEIIQKGSPYHLYKQPVNEYVAALFGKYNLISTSLISPTPLFKGLDLDEKNNFIRPEDIQITSKKNSMLKGQVKEVLFLGSSFEIIISIGDDIITVRTSHTSVVKGNTVYLSMSPDAISHI